MKTAARQVTVLDARVVAGAGGGPDKTIINSPGYLQGTGYKMLCAYLHAEADPGFDQLRKKAAAKGVDLLSIFDQGALDWRVVPRMLKACRDNNVEVWHGHDYKTNLLGLVLKRLHPMRLVTTLHGWVHHTARTPLYYKIDKATLRYYELVICVSEDLYLAARKAGVPATRCEILENGIDLEDYRRRRTVADAKKALGFDPARILIGACGRLSKEKGFDLLIDAVARLRHAYPAIECVIVGEGDEKENLERLIGQLGLQDHVKLLGYRSDLPQLFEAFDIFCLSSHREGLPNVVLEAMATEVPVVATAVNGVPKLVRDGESGILVSAGSAERLAEGLEPFLKDERLRERFGKAGRNVVEAHYSFARRMGKLTDMYDRLLRK